jgi:hypothetical protein
MLKKRYRIVTDRYLGYEVQVKYWWWPWWIMPFSNTHYTIEKAKELVDTLKSKDNWKRQIVLNFD